MEIVSNPRDIAGNGQEGAIKKLEHKVKVFENALVITTFRRTCAAASASQVMHSSNQDMVDGCSFWLVRPPEHEIAV